MAARYSADLPGTVKAEVKVAKVAWLRERLRPRLQELVVPLAISPSEPFPQDEVNRMFDAVSGRIEQEYEKQLDALIEVTLGY